MPLIVLLPVVIFGILGIAVLLHLMGKSTRLALVNEDQVRQIWQAQYPNSTIRRVHLASTRTQALLETATGIGLVWSMGIRAACRELPLAPVVSKTPSGFDISTGDYTAPKQVFRFDDPKEAAHWLSIVKGTKA